jgi:hypothetical protein
MIGLHADTDALADGVIGMTREQRHHPSTAP